METPLVIGLRVGMVLAGLVALLAPDSSAQIVSLPFDLVDVADDPLAPDFCGVTLKFKEWDPATEVEAGGANWADFDNDGLIDLFLPNSKGEPSKLYRNEGDGTFVDEAVARGVDDPNSASAGAIFFDYDHDGDLDLLVLAHLSKYTSTAILLGPIFRFYRNTGAAGGYTFTDVTSSSGFVLGPTAKTTKYGLVGGIAVGDYDQDSWPDFFATWYHAISTLDQWRLFHNVPNPVPGDPLDPAYTPRILEDETVGSGTEGEWGGHSHTPRWWDVNRDGWPDLHVAMDFVLDVLFINNHDGTFTEVASSVGLNGNPTETLNEMGSALGDTDNDLDFDLHITNIFDRDRLFRNDSVATTLAFIDTADETGLNNTRWGWGTVFADMDNDGDLDHASACGRGHDFTDTYNTVHLNLFPQQLPDGITGAWEDVGELLVDFTKEGVLFGDAAHALGAADYDGDGDLDFVLGRNQGLFSGVFKNTLSSTNRWLQIDLVNTGGSLDTTGARVYLKNAGLTQVREVHTGGSTRTQDAARLHFGLGPPPPSRGRTIGGGSPLAAGGTAAGAGSVGLPGAVGGGVSTPTFQGNALPGPSFLVVRWPDGPCQTVLAPSANIIHTVMRSSVNDVGDLDADGHLTSADEALLTLAVADPTAYALAYPDSPGLITGDVDDNGVLDSADLAAWALLPPH